MKRIKLVGVVVNERVGKLIIPKKHKGHLIVWAKFGPPRAPRALTVIWQLAGSQGITPYHAAGLEDNLVRILEIEESARQRRFIGHWHT